MRPNVAKELCTQQPTAAQDMVNINTLDDFGWTPLMCAAGAGQLNAVAELLARGADYRLVDSKNRDARALAIMHGALGVVQLIDVCCRTHGNGCLYTLKRKLLCTHMAEWSRMNIMSLLEATFRSRFGKDTISLAAQR